MRYRSALFWLGFILIIPQALYVRRMAHRAAPAPGARTGVVGSGESRFHLYSIGDSIIDGVGTSGLQHAIPGQTAASLAQQLGARVAWHAAGKSGHRAAQVLELLNSQPPDNSPEFVLVSVGVNDVTGLRTLRQWRLDLRNLLQALSERCAEASILMIGLPPMGEFPLLPQPLRALFGLRARQFEEAALAEISKFECVKYSRIDLAADADSFAEDGYHPSERACTALGHDLAAKLLPHCQR